MKTAKQSNLGGFDEKKLKGYLMALDADVKNLFEAFKKRIRFGDGTDGDTENISGEFQVVADTGAANTNFSVTHNLSVTPVGYLVVKNSTTGAVYDGTGSWTATDVNLRCSAANAAITIFLLK